MDHMGNKLVYKDIWPDTFANFMEKPRTKIVTKGVVSMEETMKIKEIERVREM